MFGVIKFVPKTVLWGVYMYINQQPWYVQCNII